MTPTERQWLQIARRDIRLALVKAEIGDWDAVVSCVHPYSRAVPSGAVPIEVSNLLASLGTSNPSDLRGSAAMRAAAIRRLEETKVLIGESLVANDH